MTFIFNNKNFFQVTDRIGRHSYFIVYIYINIKPNIHFNLQHDISDPTFCASDPKPPKIKKPFNVFNFQNYYFTLTRVWRRSKEVKGQKDEVDHH